jgi:hypothetical protein
MAKVFYTGTKTNYPDTFYGCATTLTVPNFGGGAEDKNVWTAMTFADYIEDGVVKRQWAQWGVADNKTWGIMPVFHFYLLGGGGEYTPPMRLVNGGLDMRVGEKIRFSIENIPGTNLWNFCRNGIVIWEVDMKVSSGVKIELMAEATANKLPKMPAINFFPAVEMKGAEGWYGLNSAIANQSQWPMKGNEQDSSLQKNELIIGGNGKALPVGTKLW